MRNGAPILRATDPELAVRVSVPPLGARREWSADEPRRLRASQGRVHLGGADAEERRTEQHAIVFDEAARALRAGVRQYDRTTFIGGVRRRVDRWRELPDPGSWQVTPETARLLRPPVRRRPAVPGLRGSSISSSRFVLAATRSWRLRDLPGSLVVLSFRPVSRPLRVSAFVSNFRFQVPVMDVWIIRRSRTACEDSFRWPRPARGSPVKQSRHTRCPR